jgi:hypothetical protein
VIRKALPVILKGYGIDSGLLTNAKADRSKDAVVDGLLRFPAERKATLYPPILFPGSTRNMNEVFTGPIIMDVSSDTYMWIIAGITNLAFEDPPSNVFWAFQSYSW